MPSPDLTIPASSAAEVRGRLMMVESSRLVAGRSLPAASGRLPRRVYVVTREGRREAGISDVRSTKA